MAGTIGHLLLLTALAACGASTWFYFRSARLSARRDARQTPAERDRLALRGRQAWYVSLGSIVAASAILMYLILSHQFQYAYVYSYTSLDLPFFFTLSAFWAGQEGSFLFWILLNALVGWGLIAWARSFEAPVMTFVGLCQFFMLSMVAGVTLGALQIGVSPFQLVSEKFAEAPAGFVPADGQGLNDLLQNFWMVIHPPVLFVGFSVMMVPFAYAAAGLWQRRYTEWVRPALPWALFANFALMAGIALGGYWAYETLSFGGYWAWDPVENTSLIPWLVSVGAIHAMLAQKKSGTNQKAAFLLNIFAFLLVIYSTFLTRSGILGDTSVHSFVDLGLNNQLLLWILAMSVAGFGLFAAHARALPTPDREVPFFSREFLIFSGVVLLVALAAVILIGTSAPIFGRLFQESPSAVAISFYNEWSLPLTAGLVFFVGLAQLVWWRKMTREQVNDVVFKPMLLATAATAAVLLFTPLVETVVRPATAAAAEVAVVQSGIGGVFGRHWETFGYGLLVVLLVFGSFFALFSNVAVLWKVMRGNPRMVGGAVTHIGLVLMTFGILTSSLFGNTLSDPSSQTGGREAFVVERGLPRAIEGYTVEYTGQAPDERGHMRYHLRFEDARGRTFEARPVAYKNDKGQWFQSPDTRSWFEKDLYVAVSPQAMFGGNEQGNTADGQLVLARGDSATVGEGAYRIRFASFDMQPVHPGIPETASIAVAAVLDVTETATGARRTLQPIYYMGAEHGSVSYIPATDAAWNLAVTLTGMQVDGGAVRLKIDGAAVPETEWLVVQAHEKPFIWLLWFGLTVMLGGFGLSIYRRATDQRPRNRHHAE